jgi:hypothetical protein
MSYEEINNNLPSESKDEFTQKIQYVDKNGTIQHFETTEEYTRFREEENENQN